MNDLRFLKPDWSARPPAGGIAWRVRLLAALALPLAVWYFSWLLEPGRVGQPVLYGLLIAAEVFNLAQGLGFWWTCAHERVRERLPLPTTRPAVDVFIPVYNEPVDVVEPALVAATKLRGAEVRVHLLDDGKSEDMRRLAARTGANYVRRTENKGAKAGNINHALGVTGSPYVAVFDCDHVPDPAFLEATLGWLSEGRVAFVQTPQYYANARENPIAAASAAQQNLFFGPIARGKDGLSSMICCGTNMIFRRDALEEVGGFPTDSVTEDFELSILLREHGWEAAYLPEVLARGLGPEDMASYVSQQHRWARGCLSALPRILRARLPWRAKAQYLLSSMYFVSGWTVLVYMSLPVIRMLTGAQPVAGATADEFLLHFAPYFTVSLVTVAVAGAGTYTFQAFALSAASFWIHVHASIKAVLRRPSRFVVTPKKGGSGRQPRAAAAPLVTVAVLLGSAVYGLAQARTPSTFNNVAFVALHVSVLIAGIWPALVRPRVAAAAEAPEQPAHLEVQAA
jgi:cellulose synthase (UDP-forming)